MNNNSMIFIGLDTYKMVDQPAYGKDKRLSQAIPQGLEEKKLSFVLACLPASFSTARNSFYKSILKYL